MENKIAIPSGTLRERLLPQKRAHRNRVSFCAVTVNCYFRNRNPVSFSGQRNGYTETGFLFVLSQLTVISTTETRFLFRGKETGTQKPGFFCAATVNCYFHNRNPVSLMQE
ncbi:hypothetical protein [Planktothricoides raciborskii]|uniref:Uncharacterized protein n=1 Tax=Planktothricoides raciborskii GIHE-MW2 TaxID=2792601 RepID=A0AAU8J802_9CYAN